jgi:hypothetical protein
MAVDILDRRNVQELINYRLLTYELEAKKLKNEISAIAQDSKWLIDNGYSKIDIQVFSSRVTRDWNDAFDSAVKPVVDEIRQSVIDKIIQENNA